MTANVRCWAASLTFLALLACNDAVDVDEPMFPDASAVFPDAPMEAPDLGEAPEVGPEDLGEPDMGFPDAMEPDMGDPRTFEERLAAVEGLTFMRLSASPGRQAYLIGLEQPEDHAAPDGKRFVQRLVLVHRDESAPVVMNTIGYSLLGGVERWAQDLLEPSEALDANQLSVEHRFFGESIAENADWTKLTVEQSAADTHRIIELLSPLYTEAWVGTGISKGGMTALFHHAFFPEDFAAVVPYVAPVSFGVEDMRYVTWIRNIGPSDGVCRTRLRGLITRAVEDRRAVAEIWTQDFAARAYPLDVLAVWVAERAESYEWLFWQYAGTVAFCNSLPDPRFLTPETLARFFPFQVRTGTIAYSSDTGPYQYQVYNELGGPMYNDPDFTGPLMADVDRSIVPPFVFETPPWGENPTTLDASVMIEVDRFLREDAQHVLGIYGAWDPWSGGRITVDPENDNRLFTVDEASHGARLANLPRAQLDEAIDLLNLWIGRSFDNPDWTDARARIQAASKVHLEILEEIRTIEAAFR